MGDFRPTFYGENMKYAKNVSELIGNTPIIQLNSIYSNIYAKCEFLNPTSSVKDRVALNMIKTALKNGDTNKDTLLVEPTSGNTGIGLASICASMGLRLVLTMPSSMSIERRKILSAFGAKLVLTDPTKGMSGAVEEAQKIVKQTPNSFMLSQFENIANPQAHVKTADEIWQDMDGNVDILVIAVGTGGSISGIGKELKKYNKNLYIVAVEPKTSAVLSGDSPSTHKIQGIGAGFIPKILDFSIIDEIIQVCDEDAINTSRLLAKNEGLLVGISSGANVYVSRLISKKYPSKNIVTILCDTGERYLSGELFK